MKHIEKLIYLEQEVAKNIEKIKTKSERNKTRSYTVSMSSAVLGALVTIALGLQTASLAAELKNFALVCGALISVVNAIDSVFAHRALWIKQKVTLLQLYSLRNEIAFYRAGLEESEPISERKLTEFFKKYQAIWDSASNEWLRLRQEQEQEETKTNA